MGQCYSISLRVRFTDEAAAVKALQNKISRAEEERINYNLDKCAERGLTIHSIWHLLRIFFADHPYNCYKDTPYSDDPTFHHITNYFDACYGWAYVMIDAFKDIVPFLADGSFCGITGDNDVFEMTVQDGKTELQVSNIDDELDGEDDDND